MFVKSKEFYNVRGILKDYIEIFFQKVSYMRFISYKIGFWERIYKLKGIKEIFLKQKKLFRF